MTHILNYIKVDDKISTAGQPTVEQFKLIAERGFDAIINLALCDSANAIENEDKIVTQNGMTYIHIPISWEYPEIERLKLFLKTLDMLQKEKKKIFVHCAKNYRVSVFIYHYKKTVLREKDCKLIAPKDFIPDETWTKVINTDITI